MIKLVDENNLQEACEAISSSLLGTKIICLLNAYGTDKSFINAWCCYNDEKITAVFCRFDASVTLVLVDDSSADEVRFFLDMLDFSSLCCTEKAAYMLGYDKSSVKKAYLYSDLAEKVTSENIGEKFYREYYKIVCDNIPDSFENTTEAYLNFISDFTYRKNRGYARMKGVIDGDEIISGALTSAETKDSAIISAVACEPDSRKRGIGKRTVLSLASELQSENKKVYVIALNESAEGFYEHIGFKYIENIAFIERK